MTATASCSPARSWTTPCRARLDVPSFVLDDHPAPATTNPLGVKGCGEAGCAGALTSMMNAVIDALAELRHPPYRHAADAGEHLAGAARRQESRQDGTPAMTEAISVRTIRPAESRLIAGVCAAHMMSHYYMLMLAPLLAFIRDDFDVSYTELALALTVFNVVSGAAANAGRFPGRPHRRARCADRRAGAVSSIAFAIAGIVDSYWVFIAMYGVAGLGNTVYHPSDYSLLSHHAPSDRLSQVFSYHTFAGMVGSAIAPVTLLYMQSLFGWRGAYIGAAIFGLIVLVALIAQPEPARTRACRQEAARRATAADDPGWRLLMSPPILLNLAFFILISIMGGGLNTYLVVALGALHATPPAIANMALTVLLAMNAARRARRRHSCRAHRASRRRSRRPGSRSAASSRRWSGLFDFPLGHCSSC